MGNYNTQYQSYYNNLAKKQRSSNNFASESNKQNKRWNFYIKRLTQELIGVLVLLAIVLICKVIVTPKTQYVYNYSKEVINKQYDYNKIIDKAMNVKFEDIEALTVNFIQKVKNTISIEDEINNDNNNLEQINNLQQF